MNESTELDQTALGKITTGFIPEDVTITSDEKIILKELAAKVATIAASSQMKEKRLRWYAINKLQKITPIIFCDPENGWNEIITEDQMMCKGKLARQWEMDLRKEIFWGEKMGDDKPVEKYFNVPYIISEENWGLAAHYHKTNMQYGSESWDAPIKDYEKDLPKLHDPEFQIDWNTTQGCVDLAKDIFHDILEVRLQKKWWWTLGLTLRAVKLRGLTNLYTDFLEQPDNLKQLLSRISKGHLKKLDYLEANNLLSLNNDGTYVGSGGFGFTDELPRKNFSSHVRCIDTWGFAESQETVYVSPELYEEFIFEYEKPILDRFGLNCYGCCEPLDSRWHIVKRHHNLRRVSCSPWVDLEKMAKNLEDKYVFSMKPNPASLATSNIDRDSIRKELRNALEITKDCIVEIIMKDNHTIGHRPENVIEWCRIAREEAEKIAT